MAEVRDCGRDSGLSVAGPVQVLSVATPACLRSGIVRDGVTRDDVKTDSDTRLVSFIARTPCFR